MEKIEKNKATEVSNHLSKALFSAAFLAAKRRIWLPVAIRRQKSIK
jgi:hypothetical protein